MATPIVVVLVGAAVSLGLPADPKAFGEVLASEWIARRRRAPRGGRRVGI